MARRLDILVVGMDKITDKSCYIYDSFVEQGVNCLIYSRDKTGFHDEVKGRVKVPVKIVPQSLVLEIAYFLLLVLSKRPRHVELYQTHTVSLFFYSLSCLIFRIPLVVVCIGELYHWEEYRSLKKAVLKLSYFTARLIVLTELYMEETVARFRLADKRKLIFCNNRVPIKGNHSAERDGKTVLFLNSFKPWRRLELLIDAAPLVIEKVPAARFLLVGSTRKLNYLKGTHQYDDGLLKEIRDRGLDGHVEILPFTPDPAEYYERASVFALPADLVFCNFSLLEAMERCVPAVVADVEGSDLIIDDGVDGLIVKQDGRAFAQAILALLLDEELRRGMGLKAREKILNRFDIRMTTKILAEGYRSHLRSWERFRGINPAVAESSN
jgi:glycosyltransferase involved in cell wall biosynthesis